MVDTWHQRARMISLLCTMLRWGNKSRNWNSYMRYVCLIWIPHTYLIFIDPMKSLTGESHMLELQQWLHYDSIWTGWNWNCPLSWWQFKFNRFCLWTYVELQPISCIQSCSKETRISSRFFIRTGRIRFSSNIMGLGRFDMPSQYLPRVRIFMSRPVAWIMIEWHLTCCYRSEIRGICLSPDGNHLAIASEDPSITFVSEIWYLTTGMISAIVTVPLQSKRCRAGPAHIHVTNAWVTGRWTYSVVICLQFSTNTGKQVCKVDGKTWFQSMAWHPHSNLLAVATDDRGNSGSAYLRLLSFNSTTSLS